MPLVAGRSRTFMELLSDPLRERSRAGDAADAGDAQERGGGGGAGGGAGLEASSRGSLAASPSGLQRCHNRDSCVVERRIGRASERFRDVFALSPYDHAERSCPDVALVRRLGLDASERLVAGRFGDESPASSEMHRRRPRRRRSCAARTWKIPRKGDPRPARGGYVRGVVTR